MNPALLKNFLSKKMTRREFLIYVGVLVLAVSGIAGVFERISQTQKVPKSTRGKRAFGSGAYGV